MAASSGAFVAALLGVALQGCGGWTEEAYCKEKVRVECENFDRLFAKHEASNKEGLGIMLHKASHLRFYKQCKEKDAKGWEELEKQCKGLKDKDVTLGDGSKCKPSVSAAMAKHEDLSLGRTVLGCIEKGLEADGKEEFAHEAKPETKGGGTDEPVEAAPKVYYCDCREKDDAEGCSDGVKALPTDPEVEDHTQAKELCEAQQLKLMEWKCKGHEECTALDPGLVGKEADAVAKCREMSPAGAQCDLDNDASELAADIEPLDTEKYKCKKGEDSEELHDISTDELQAIYTETHYSSGPYTTEVTDALAKLCGKKGGDFLVHHSELQLSSKVHDLPAHPPAPRRKRAGGLVLAQDRESTRVEVDSSGVAKVRSFETPPRAGAGAEVKPGKSQMVSE